MAPRGEARPCTDGDLRSHWLAHDPRAGATGHCMAARSAGHGAAQAAETDCTELQLVNRRRAPRAVTSTPAPPAELPRRCQQVLGAARRADACRRPCDDSAPRAHTTRRADALNRAGHRRSARGRLCRGAAHRGGRSDHQRRDVSSTAVPVRRRSARPRHDASAGAPARSTTNRQRYRPPPTLSRATRRSRRAARTAEHRELLDAAPARSSPQRAAGRSVKLRELARRRA